MPSYISAAKVLLPCLSVAGYYCTYRFSERTGYFDLVRNIRAGQPPLLPGTQVPAKLVYTGTGYPIDYFLAQLATIFWPAVDGTSPHLSLLSFEFTGQMMAFWVVFEMESRRLGNRGRLITFLAVWGAAMQLASFAVIFPIYLCLYLFTSPLSFGLGQTTAERSAANLYVPVADLRALPLSTLIGFVLPSVMTCLPSPSFTSLETRQIWMAVWQSFPLCIGLVQLAFSRVFSVMSPVNVTFKSAAERNTIMLEQLRRVYIFAFAFSSITHVAACTLSLSSLLFPVLFDPRLLSYLHPKRVLLPPMPNTTAPTTNIGDGILYFLLYDEYIGSLATIIWALVIHENAHTAAASWGGWMTRLWKVGVLTVLAGPASAVTLLLWERDKLILELTRNGDEKKDR